MSWWVNLVDENEEAVSVPLHNEGGTIQVGGYETAMLNVTYNYGVFYREVMGGNGLWDLEGMVAADAAPILWNAVLELGVIKNPDYWAATRGNAGAALLTLWTWAHAHPTAKFVVR